MSAALRKALLGLLAVAVVLALLLHLMNTRFRPPPSANPKTSSAEAVLPSPPASRPDSDTDTLPAKPKAEPPLLPPVSRYQTEDWLAKHARNASSLLAAYRVLNDTNYLNEAATNFPNDPRVELAVLARDEFPGDRRKWLDLFKASSPSNSLANYLSAQDYFKSGQTNEAIGELLAANGKTQFDSYMIDSQLNSEQLARFAGKSPTDLVEISLGAGTSDTFSMTSTIKHLANEVADLAGQQGAAGDSESAQNLVQTGVLLAQQMKGGDSGKLIINQLVGIAIETKSLGQLDPNTAYSFLGGQTPADVIQQFKAEKANYRELISGYDAAAPNLSEEEMSGYLDRSKIYGEAEAMKWVIQQHPPAPANP
jgi:hypothetical protein